jgi:hypothetical protein
MWENWVFYFGGFEIEMIIHPTKSRAACFTRAYVTGSLNYLSWDSNSSSSKYLGIILCSNVSWADQDNYTVKKKSLQIHFTMLILKKRNSNRKINVGFAVL